MRITIVVGFVLLLAGCGTTPVPVITPDRPAASGPSPQRGGLIGLDANALATRLGRPRLKVREGDGTKLQFAGGSCLLDAYLYPGGSGPPRVTHIDTRTRDGRAIAQAECIRMLEGP